MESLAKLRGLAGDGVEEELQALEAVVQAETDNVAGNWRESCARLLDRTVLLPMALLVFLFFTQSFSGSNMVSYYTVTILQMAEIPLDENLTAILVAAQYVFGYCLSSLMVTRIPRRALLMASLALMMTANLAAGLVLLGKHSTTADTAANVTDNQSDSQHHLTIVDADNMIGVDSTIEEQEDLPSSNIVSLIPVFSCIFITFGYACGLGPVPFILFGELFPSSVRGNATSITAFLRSITVFLSIKIFPSLLWLCDIGGSFLSCAFVCGLAIVVSFVFVPETRGLDLEQLENIYKKKKPQASPDVSESLLSTE